MESALAIHMNVAGSIQLFVVDQEKDARHNWAHSFAVPDCLVGWTERGRRGIGNNSQRVRQVSAR